VSQENFKIIQMNYRKFGKTELLVSEIGFGAWAIGGKAMVGNTPIGWGVADDDVSKKAIVKSLDLGINFFDTADIYGLGHSEELIGNIIGNRKDVVIASKVGNVSRNNKFTFDYSKEYILKACENSLIRLKREAIDYYQLHTAQLSHLQQEECIEAMQILKDKGKIRYWGLSLNTFDPFPEADYLMDSHLGSGFQLVLNILNQQATPLMKKAAALKYGIIARMPLQFGLLTGKFDGGAKFHASDHRKTRLTEDLIHVYKRDMKYVWELTEKYNISKTQLALSFILSYPEVSTIIPGIRTAEQAQNNTQGLVRLDKADKELIENNNFTETLNLIQELG